MNKSCSLAAVLNSSEVSNLKGVNRRIAIAKVKTLTADINTLPVFLLATSQPSYTSESKPLINKGFILSYAELVFKSNSVFLTELNKINVIDLVAVTGNNAKQELQNLLNTVQHHTIVGVFFCLSFSNLPVMGGLRLALALVRLWWGGGGNKPSWVNTACRACLAVLNLPAALHLGRINKTTMPFRKV
jgi:hypothetical protein